MSTVEDVIARKGARVVSVFAGDTVLEAARVMNAYRIGSVVVHQPDSAEVAGILTERDILTRVVAAARDPRNTFVSDVMTTPVFTCARHTPIDDVRDVMRSRRIRHVPVVEGDRLVGMISIGDLNAHESDRLTQTVEVLETYISRG